jgi:hypothetical protein
MNFCQYPAPDFVNPSLGPDRESLWEQMKKNAKPLPKEELLKRAEKLRKNSGK